MTLPVVFTANGPSGYNLTNSLRFRSSASAYLNRTPASATNRQTFTLSLWMKRGTLSTNQAIFSASDGTQNNEFLIYLGTTDTITIQQTVGGSSSGQIAYTTNAVFRDPSAWYHIVLAVDTTQATSTNRLLFYVNGVSQTSSLYSVGSSINTWVNNTNAHAIAKRSDASLYFDGYLTEINFIDGQALTPSSFGETSTTTGVWIPKKYTGTYGTNGFYLPFTDNSALTTSSNVGLGKDFSGNSNYWTTNNISITSGVTYDSMTDVPTLTSATAANYSTLNPTLPIPAGTISQGSLNYLRGSTANHGSAGATFTLPITGKWYWEVTACANSGGSGNNETIGVANILNNPQLPAISSEIGGGSRGDYGYRSDGNKYNNGNQGAYGATYTNSDVIGVAWDSDAGTLVFYKNGSSQGTAFSSIAQVADKFVPASSNAESSNGDSYNFGQRPFAYTPPTGFNRLNTFNLPTPTIGATASSQANKYMNIALYTGTGSSQSITGLGFQPDWTWIKGRSGATDHGLYDAVRGVQKQLESNNTDAETTETTGLTAFGSDGFTVGALAQLNTSSATYVGWNWKANGAGSSNTAGTITSTVSANTSAGFSIVTWTGNAASSATIGHGLGVAPSMIIVKNRSATWGWFVYNKFLTNPNTGRLQLNLTNAEIAGGTPGPWNNTAPTSTVFSLGDSSFPEVNGSGNSIVAYCFAPIAGYSAFGSYTGNGSTDGPFVFTGFRPRFLLIKNSSTTVDWVIEDTSRDPYNVVGAELFPNLSNAESSGNADLDILSNGFKIRRNSTFANGSGNTIIYAAFAESPFKYSNAR
jgi:hypothetical protein